MTGDESVRRACDSGRPTPARFPRRHGLPELRSLALLALEASTVDDRLRLTRAIDDPALPCAVDAALDDPGDIPGRPARPVLVAPSALPARPATGEGRAALLHALAHIEFNAIALALDHLWRFSGMPEAYYRDWAAVAVEEADHFARLRARLNAAGFDYGDFAAHDGLWDSARRSAGDVLDRMALVRTLEARGLDASPAVRAKFEAAGDLESARVIDVILRDEIGHVRIGNRWFHEVCARRRLDPALAHRQALQRCGLPRPRGPLNVPARLQAGFSAAEIEALRRGGATI